MKLESVVIKNFRSVETAKLIKCGRFNVLIGKNNSLANQISFQPLTPFFTCIQDGDFAKLNPTIGMRN